jgi:hypothetical protein
MRPSATPATDFVQQAEEGAPSRTARVRFLDDDNAVGDTSPKTRSTARGHPAEARLRGLRRRPRRAQSRHFGDRLNGHASRPLACAARLAVIDEGRNINANWDGVWTCCSIIDADGFTYEQAIPFKQFAFRARPSRKAEPVPPDPPYAACFTASATRRGRNICVKPFAGDLTRRNGTQQASFDGGSTSRSARQQPVLDATLRTDSRRSADTQQVNLTRQLFFPERREFFLENGGQLPDRRLRTPATA